MIERLLAAIPVAATSPIALVAYLAAIVVWGILVYRVKTLNSVNSTIKDLPENDRLPALRNALGEVDVGQFTPLQYIKLKKNRSIFHAFLVVCAVLVIISALAYKETLDREQLTNDLIKRTLEPPSSQFMSAYNTIANSPESMFDLNASMANEPEISDQDLDSSVDNLVLQGLDFKEIVDALKGRSGGGQLQKINTSLLKASGRVEYTMRPMSECFLQQRCTNSASKMHILCRKTNDIQSNIDLSNEMAAAIPGVTFNSTGTVPLIGGGALDRYYVEVKVPNVQYINTHCV